MASASRSYRDEGYTVPRAINDVFGRWPAWPWSVLVLIVLGGVAGATASTLLAGPDAVPSPALRWAACTGYGALLAAFVTTLPRAVKLLSLRSAVGRRPAADNVDPPWWPLRLLAAALRQTPTLRLTQQDFSGAVGQAAGEARSLLTYRLWPACVAGFVAPVFGLLSAWESGSQVELKPGEDAASIYMRVLPQVSPPMVAAISAALVLMIVLAMLDQFTKGLLQKWATTVTLADANSDFVQRTIGEGRTAELQGLRHQETAVEPPPTGEPTSSHGRPKILADDLEKF